jgi:DNA-binding MurR/RpiR family transcriptional regulator
MNTTDPWTARLAGITSPAERKVAEYLIRAGAKAAPMTAQEIASNAGTSDATVVRTARSLGFESLRELRQALGEAHEADIASRFQATISAGPGAHRVLEDAIVRQVQDLEGLHRRIGAAEFDDACRLLAGAEEIWWSGTGPSASLAEYAAFLCRRHGLSAGALTHAGTDHADELLAVRRDHVIVLFAYGRIHRYVRVLLTHAAEVGAQVVLVTDVLGPSLESPIAVKLNAGRGTPSMFASHGQTVVLIESLVLGAAGTDPVRSQAALSTLNSLRHALAGVPIDVDPP